MASDVTDPIPTVDPALEVAASALRADLAVRGVRADELPEAVVLALVVSLADRDRRIGDLERRLARLEDRLSPVNTQVASTTWTYVPGGPADPAGRSSPDVPSGPGTLPGSIDPGPDDLDVSPPPEAPRFRHDCPDCVFLGQSDDGRDLYFCPGGGFGDTVLVRWGSDPGDCLRAELGYARTNEGPHPHLAEAHRRAVARGLVGGAGDGEGG
jgi:hypothetical protein